MAIPLREKTVWNEHFGWFSAGPSCWLRFESVLLSSVVWWIQIKEPASLPCVYDPGKRVLEHTLHLKHQYEMCCSKKHYYQHTLTVIRQWSPNCYWCNSNHSNQILNTLLWVNWSTSVLHLHTVWLKQDLGPDTCKTTSCSCLVSGAVTWNSCGGRPFHQPSVSGWGGQAWNTKDTPATALCWTHEPLYWF